MNNKRQKKKIYRIKLIKKNRIIRIRIKHNPNNQRKMLHNLLNKEKINKRVINKKNFQRKNSIKNKINLKSMLKNKIMAVVIEIILLNLEKTRLKLILPLYMKIKIPKKEKLKNIEFLYTQLIDFFL